MAAAQRTCDVCSSDFYGRADATYCSSGCRQKAYRHRKRYGSRVTHRQGSAPVAEGDDWMRDRFGHGMSARHRAFDDNDGSETIRDYVQGITYIGRELFDDSAGIAGHDLSTPLGDALPAHIDPATAAQLAADLHAAIPRVIELASLLDRRARMTPLPMKVPFNA